MDANQQQQEKADALDQQVRADAQVRTSSNGQKSTAPASSSDGQGGGRQANASGAGAGGSRANSASHGATGPSQASNTTPGSGASQGQGGGRRSKHKSRSRRLGKLRKNSVGIPPPQPDQVEDSALVIEVDPENRPLLRASGIGREYGGHERERS